MRFEYNNFGHFMMKIDNDYEFEIMNRIYEEIFEIDFTQNYDYYRENGFLLAYSNETELKSIIEKMKYDRIERLLQIRNKNYTVRLTSRVMLKLWG